MIMVRRWQNDMNDGRLDNDGGMIWENDKKMIRGECWHNDDDIITKGSSSGATLSFALRSKGEGGQPRYLIIQEIASNFSTGQKAL